MIELENISKIYGDGKNECLALDSVSIEINQGDFIALTGPSGSGKSTLMNIIGLMDKQTDGKYILDNVDTCLLNEKQKATLRNKRFGFVLQSFGLIDEWSVTKNISVPLLYSKISKKERTEVIENVMNKLGIIEKRNELSKNLSGGQKQRVAIARAIINNPSIILADEPTGALDRKNSEEVMKIFSQLNKEGKTILVVTHDPFVASLCKDEIKIQNGRI